MTGQYSKYSVLTSLSVTIFVVTEMTIYLVPSSLQTPINTRLRMVFCVKVGFAECAWVTTLIVI